MTDSTRREEDYDSPWKTLLEHYFPAFLEWFFPTVAADVDWARGFEFLDKPGRLGTAHLCFCPIIYKHMEISV